MISPKRFFVIPLYPAIAGSVESVEQAKAKIEECRELVSQLSEMERLVRLRIKGLAEHYGLEGK